MESKRHNKFLAALALLFILLPATSLASHISGIRITQTASAGLAIDVDITAFYTTGSTASEAYLGTYYNAVPAIDWGDGATTPRYGYGPSTGLPLVATSTVVNGLPARAFRGSFSHTYAAPGTYTISANTRCCPLTTPTNTLVTGSIMTTTITTTGVFGPTTFTTSYVQNTLAVVASPPAFDKAFAPNPVGQASTSTLTFMIDNTASTLDANDIAFIDNLPAGLVVATPANVVNTCTDGTITATPGSAMFSYVDGTVAAGATCTISVDVMATMAGVFVNTTGDLTSSHGNSGTATDTLTVDGPPAFSKAFNPVQTGVGIPSTLTFTIDHSAATSLDATMLAFTDTFPAGLVVSSPANESTDCTGGTVTATPGSGSVSLAGGTVAFGSTCMVSVDVEAAATGDYANTSGSLTSSLGDSGTASATLTVSAAPVFTKAFATPGIAIGDTTTLTFTIDNSANSTATTGLMFNDPLPNGMIVATPANVVNTCTGGTVTAADGSGSIDYTGGTVPAQSICTISVDVTVTQPGEFENIASLNSSLGSSGLGSATASLVVPNNELEIPTLSEVGLAFLASVLALLALVVMRRSRERSAG